MPTGTLQNSQVFGGAPVRFDVRPLPASPDGQVRATIDLMRHYALADCSHPLIIEDAREAAASDPINPLRGVWSYVKRNFTFSDDTNRARVIPVQDPGDIIEVIVRPIDASTYIRSGAKNAEDCDGYSTYLASLLLALGYQPSFVTIAADPAIPNEYSHVYVAAYDAGGQRVAMDASHGGYFGWEAPHAFRKTEWPLLQSSWDVWSFGKAVLAGVVGCAIANYFLRDSVEGEE